MMRFCKLTWKTQFKLKETVVQIGVSSKQYIETLRLVLVTRYFIPEVFRKMPNLSHWIRNGYTPARATKGFR